MARARSGSSSGSSDSSCGGAPLKSQSGSTTATSQATTILGGQFSMDGARSLMQASRSFGDIQNNPFVPAPQVPSSVPPSDSFRPSNPYAAGNQFHQGAFHNTASATQDQQMGSTNSSMAISGWNPGNPNGSFSEEPTWKKITNIQARLALLHQIVHMVAGPNSDLTAQTRAAIQEVIQMINVVANELTQERDGARQIQREESTRLKKSLHDHRQARDCDVAKLSRELEVAHDAKRFVEQQTDHLKGQIKALQEQIGTMGEDGRRFREHHERLIKAYTDRDDSHSQQVRDLEAQVQQLRAASSNAAQDDPAGSKPDSMALVKVSNFATEPDNPFIRYDSTAIQRYQNSRPGTAALGLDHNNGIQGNFSGTNANFNPEAPAWNPVSGEYRSASPPKAPRFMRLAQAASQAGTNPATTLSGMTAFNNQVSNMRSRSGTQGSQTDVYGVNRPMTAMPQLQQPRSMGSSANTPRHNLAESTTPAPLSEAMWLEILNKGSWEEDDVKSTIEHIQSLIKGYIASCHSDSPRVTDKALALVEPKTWQYIVYMAFEDFNKSNSYMSGLLQEPHYRHYILQRMLTDYITRKMFTPSIFLGYSPAMDGHLSALQEQIEAHGTPTVKIQYADAPRRARQKVIEEHARAVQTILEKADFPRFKEMVINKHATMLMMILRPLRSENVPEEQAFGLLRVLCGMIQEVSTRIWTSGMTIHFYYPDIGCKYSHPSMTVLNARQMGRTVYQMQQSHYRVQYVITPTVTLRDDRCEGLLKTYGLRKAEVLVMK